jgi:hypothetical protein
MVRRIDAHPFLCAQGGQNRIHHLAQIDRVLLPSGFAGGINARNAFVVGHSQSAVGCGHGVCGGIHIVLPRSGRRS